MKAFITGAVACAACAFAAAPAQAARPMTIQDLLTAVRVSDPQLSPDGRLVAFVRTTTDITTGKRNSDIWIVPADGSAPPKLFIGGEKSENTPRWSADGEHLAFISTRDGDPQIYIADRSGNIQGQLTKVPGGVQPPMVVSPDNAMIAFVADVYPDCPDAACNAQRREEADKNPVKVHRLTRLLYRHWDEWRDGIRHHVFVANVHDRTVRDVTPGDFDSPPTQQEDAAIAFTPDSKEVVFVSNREGNDREE